jgi:nicotinate-nucleotide adenylyltransferase
MATSAPDRRPGRRFGILGGSFNPPHTAHLVIASQACWQLGLEQVVLVPAWSPPHKTIEDRVPADIRLALTQAAVGADPRFFVSDVEIVRGTRYTVDTLAALHDDLGEADLWFLIGSDSLLAFDTWRDPTRILELCRLAVALRAGDDAPVVAAAIAVRDGAVALDVPALGISSTDVRRRVRAGAPITGLVPGPVEQLIGDLGLYRREGPAGG